VGYRGEAGTEDNSTKVRVVKICSCVEMLGSVGVEASDWSQFSPVQFGGHWHVLL